MKSRRRWEIGICGTFDVANYGDLLFPLIAEFELTERLGPVSLHIFSYNARTPPEWPYTVRSITDLPHVIRRLDGLLIGGGALIRFDKYVAPEYVPPTPEIHHPTGYWLTPALIALQHDVPVVWNAPGVQTDPIPMWAHPLLSIALTQSGYVAVRDQASGAALRSLTDAHIDVVPDTAFGCPRLLNLDGVPSAEVTRFREAAGLDNPYIVIQASPNSEDFVRFVTGHAEQFRNFQFLALPISPIFGDRNDRVDPHLPGAIRLPVWPGPLAIAELVGRSAAVVGHSFHLLVTALASGVPAFTPQKMTAGKYSALQAFETVYALPFNTEPDVEWFLTRVGKSAPSSSARATSGPLEGHWDRIAQTLRRESAPTAPTVGRFWQSLPALLENAATQTDEVVAALATRGSETQARVQEALRRVSVLDGALSQLVADHQEAAERQDLLNDSVRQLIAARTDTASPAPGTVATSRRLVAPVRPVVEVRRPIRQPQRILNIEQIRQHRLETDPYRWAAIKDLFTADHAAQLAATFPCDHFKLVAAYDGEKGYEYEARSLIALGRDVVAYPGGLSSTWRALAMDLLSSEYRAAMTTLTGCDLTRALMEVNVCHYGPGAFLGPHRDLPDKLATHVLYFNEAWNVADGGCLSILRSVNAHDLAAEIAPIVGSSAVLVRSENSWHAVSHVVNDSASSRRSMTVTFLRPGSVSPMWPADDATPLHRYDGAHLT